MTEYLPIEPVKGEKRKLFIQDGVLYTKDTTKGPGIRMLRKATALDYIMTLSHIINTATELDPTMVGLRDEFGRLQLTTIELLFRKEESNKEERQENPEEPQIDNLLFYSPR